LPKDAATETYRKKIFLELKYVTNVQLLPTSAVLEDTSNSGPC